MNQPLEASKMTAPVERTRNIQPRNMKFESGTLDHRFIFQNNSLISTFFYGLSIFFPDGERFFIHTMRSHLAKISDENLKKQVSGFIGQEAHHGRAHAHFNKELKALGFPIGKIEKHTHARTEFLINKFNDHRQLAVTTAMEHVTATYSEYFLENIDRMGCDNTTFREMLIWHSIEEIEHKSVAFDVYVEQVKNHAIRKRMLAIIYIHLLLRIAKYQYWMLKEIRHFPSIKEWLGAFRFFWGKRGMLRKTLRPLLLFFKEGFHPDKVEQQHLIDNWQQKYPEVAQHQIN